MRIIYDPDGTINLEKTDYNSLIRYYSGEMVAALAESGGKGVRMALTEFTHVIFEKQKIVNETKRKDALKAASELSTLASSNKAIDNKVILEKINIILSNI